MGYTLYHIKRISTNKVVYIGITSNSINKRFNSHLKDSRRNVRKYNYLNKHIDDIKIISVIENIKTLEEANKLEELEIKSFKLKGINLLNATNGGDGTKGYVSWNKGKKCSYIDKIIENHPNLKKVYAYTLDGKYYGEYRSIKAASENTGCPRAAIKRCCEMLPKYKQSKGLMWRYEKYEAILPLHYNENDRIERMKCGRRKKMNKVICVNLLNNKVDIYNNIQEFCELNKIKYATAYAAIKLNRKCKAKYKISYA